jgi:hypothetical protein
MSWAPVRPRATGGIDWSDPADAALFDPYLQWALAIGFRGYATDKPPHQRLPMKHQRVPVAVELLPGDDGRQRLLALVRSGTLQVPSWYLADPCLQHCTARIRTGDFWRLRGQVRRMELGVTALRSPGSTPGLPPALGPWTDDPPLPDAAPRPAAGRTVIGIVDDGCAFAHQQFRDVQGGTRVRWLWQQDGVPDAPGRREPLWSAPAGLHYGAETTAARLSALMQPGPLGEIDEAAAYRAAGMDRLALGLPAHGIGVMDFAAGRSDPMHRQMGDHGPMFSAGTAAADAAGQADIVFVQMPRRAMQDASGAWLTVHVLDAVHYVLSRAGDAGRVVVNISLGAFAGPHDGSSLLEAALDALIEQHAPRLLVVVAAGNGYRHAAHAELDLAPGQTQPVRWDIPVDDRTESFVEAWAAAVQDGPAPEPPVLQVQLDPPRGCRDPRPVVGPGDSWAWYDAAAGFRRPACVVLNAAAGAGRAGASRLVLASIAPAQPVRSAAAAARSGGWTLWLTNAGPVRARVHVYVERDDPPFGGSARQTVLVGEGEPDAAPVSPLGTLSSMATGRHTIVVGAHRLRDGTPAPFSASGPSRGPCGPGLGRMGPDLTAPGASGARSHLLAAGAHSGGAWVACQGTSIAAPVVTRQIVNLMATGQGQRLDRAGIVAALVEDAAAPCGHGAADPWRGGQGRLKHWPPQADRPGPGVPPWQPRVNEPVRPRPTASATAIPVAASVVVPSAVPSRVVVRRRRGSGPDPCGPVGQAPAGV